MAFPGTGFRSVNSLAIEISNHLVQPYVNTSITNVIAPGPANALVPSTLAMYVGAQIVVDSGLSQETVIASVVNPGVSFSANFTLPHTANCPILSPTFPVQASTDPLYTQQEILSYIARAQNEFLAQVPCVFSINTQTVQYGNILQSLVCNAIEMHRVASSSQAIAIATLTRSGSVVTAVSTKPHGLSIGSEFAMIGGSEPSFDGAFKVGTVISPTSWTYTQVLSNSSSTEGIAGLWVRLYEVSQEQLSMQDPNFRNNFVTSLRSWFQDRTGLYQFGVSGRPASNLPIEVLVSVRDTDTLQLTDGFIVPDILLHAVKYKALEYCFSKDGVQADPKRAAYCKMRFERTVMAARRWMGWSGIMEMQSGQAAGKR